MLAINVGNHATRTTSSGTAKGCPVEQHVGQAPHAPVAALGKRKPMLAEPVECLEQQRQARDAQHRPARACDRRFDRLADAAEHEPRAVGHVVAFPEHHAGGKGHRRQRNRRAQALAAPEQHIAHRQHQQAGEREQQHRIGVARKGQQDLVADIQGAGGGRIELADGPVAGLRGVHGDRGGGHERQREGGKRMGALVHHDADDDRQGARQHAGRIEVHGRSPI